MCSYKDTHEHFHRVLDHPHGHPYRAVDQPGVWGDQGGHGLLHRHPRRSNAGLLRQEGQSDRGASTCGGSQGLSIYFSIYAYIFLTKYQPIIYHFN